MRPRPRGERGGLPLEWALGIAVLVLPVTLLVAVFPSWVERQSMARLAAREAARAAALAPDPAAGVARGTALARTIVANHGVDPDGVTITVLVPAGAHGEPVRDAVATATVEVAIPVVAIPVLGSLGGWRWSVTHGERLDRYRSLPP